MASEVGSDQQYTLITPPPSLNRYPYEPLDPGRNEIRLLRYCKPQGLDSLLVSCTIGHVSLDLNPSYEALSYTWSDSKGDSQLSKNILVNGHVVAVTRNLEAALAKLLMNNDDRVLWVDALCINQLNLTERNEQVSRMRLVYQCAEGVITWLGEESNDSQGAFQLLQSFRQVGVVKSISEGPEPLILPVVLSTYIVEKIHAIIKLFTRSYWNRAWVVQETALAKRLVIHCGDEHVTWAEMKGSCEAIEKDRVWILEALYGSSIGHMSWLLSASGPYLVHHINFETPSNGTDIAKLQQTSSSVTLSELLIRHRTKQAKDPRDKVYSLLGLISEEKRSNVPVDYGLDVSSIYKNVAIFLATEEKDLRMLAENKTPQARPIDPNTDWGLPSWVPNWANTHRGDKLRIDRALPHFSAAGSSIADASMLDRDVLCVKGVRIGVIATVGMLMPDFADEEFSFAPAFEALYSWWLIFLTAGGSDITGRKGLMNIVNLGTGYGGGFPPEQIKALEKETLMHLRVVISLYRPEDDTLTPLLGRQEEHVDEHLRLQSESYIWSAAVLCRKRKLFIADGTIFGVGPQCTEEGDIAAVVLGCKVPVILRKRAKEDGGGYLNLGDAYLEGFMAGQAIKDCDDGKRIPEVFHLY